MKAIVLLLVLWPANVHAAETWTEVQVISDQGLTSQFALGLRSPVDLALEKSGQALLADPQGQFYSLLKMPEGQVTRLDVPTTREFGAPPIFIVPNGSYLHGLVVPAEKNPRGGTTWCVGGAATGEVAIPKPPCCPDGDPEPILSGDGRWTAWIERAPDGKDEFIYGHGTFFTARVLIREIEGEQTVAVRLPKDSLMEVSYGNEVKLLALDMTRRQLTVSIVAIPRDDPPVQNESPVFYSVAIDTSVATELARVPELKRLVNFRRLDHGWVAWGAPNQNSVSVTKVVWSLPAGRQEYEVQPKISLHQRSLHSVAVSPDGQWIALGINQKLGRSPGSDQVEVLRTSDGGISFHRADAHDVAFIGNDYFAYGEFNGQKKSHQIHILKVPAAADAAPGTLPAN